MTWHYRSPGDDGLGLPDLPRREPSSKMWRRVRREYYIAYDKLRHRCQWVREAYTLTERQEEEKLKAQYVSQRLARHFKWRNRRFGRYCICVNEAFQYFLPHEQVFRTLPKGYLCYRDTMASAARQICWSVPGGRFMPTGFMSYYKEVMDSTQNSVKELLHLRYGNRIFRRAHRKPVALITLYLQYLMEWRHRFPAPAQPDIWRHPSYEEEWQALCRLVNRYIRLMLREEAHDFSMPLTYWQRRRKEIDRDRRARFRLNKPVISIPRLKKVESSRQNATQAVLKSLANVIFHEGFNQNCDAAQPSTAMETSDSKQNGRASQNEERSVSLDCFKNVINHHDEHPVTNAYSASFNSCSGSFNHGSLDRTDNSPLTKSLPYDNHRRPLHNKTANKKTSASMNKLNSLSEDWLSFLKQQPIETVRLFQKTPRSLQTIIRDDVLQKASQQRKFAFAGKKERKSTVVRNGSDQTDLDYGIHLSLYPTTTDACLKQACFLTGSSPESSCPQTTAPFSDPAADRSTILANARGHTFLSPLSPSPASPSLQVQDNSPKSSFRFRQSLVSTPFTSKEGDLTHRSVQADDRFLPAFTMDPVQMDILRPCETYPDPPQLRQYFRMEPGIRHPNESAEVQIDILRPCGQDSADNSDADTEQSAGTGTDADASPLRGERFYGDRSDAADTREPADIPGRRYDYQNNPDKSGRGNHTEIDLGSPRMDQVQPRASTRHGRFSAGTDSLLPTHATEQLSSTPDADRVWRTETTPNDSYVRLNHSTRQKSLTHRVRRSKSTKGKRLKSLLTHSAAQYNGSHFVLDPAQNPPFNGSVSSTSQSGGNLECEAETAKELPLDMNKNSDCQFSGDVELETAVRWGNAPTEHPAITDNSRNCKTASLPCDSPQLYDTEASSDEDSWGSDPAYHLDASQPFRSQSEIKAANPGFFNWNVGFVNADCFGKERGEGGYATNFFVQENPEVSYVTNFFGKENPKVGYVTNFFVQENPEAGYVTNFIVQENPEVGYVTNFFGQENPEVGYVTNCHGKENAETGYVTDCFGNENTEVDYVTDCDDKDNAETGYVKGNTATSTSERNYANLTDNHSHSPPQEDRNGMDTPCFAQTQTSPLKTMSLRDPTMVQLLTQEICSNVRKLIEEKLQQGPGSVESGEKSRGKRVKFKSKKTGQFDSQPITICGPTKRKKKSKRPTRKRNLCSSLQTDEDQLRKVYLQPETKQIVPLTSANRKLRRKTVQVKDGQSPATVSDRLRKTTLCQKNEKTANENKNAWTGNINTKLKDQGEPKHTRSMMVGMQQAASDNDKPDLDKISLTPKQTQKRMAGDKRVKKTSRITKQQGDNREHLTSSEHLPNEMIGGKAEAKRGSLAVKPRVNTRPLPSQKQSQTSGKIAGNKTTNVQQSQAEREQKNLTPTSARKVPKKLAPNKDGCEQYSANMKDGQEANISHGINSKYRKRKKKKKRNKKDVTKDGSTPQTSGSENCLPTPQSSRYSPSSLVFASNSTILLLPGMPSRDAGSFKVNRDEPRHPLSKASSSTTSNTQSFSPSSGTGNARNSMRDMPSRQSKGGGDHYASMASSEVHLSHTAGAAVTKAKSKRPARSALPKAADVALNSTPNTLSIHCSTSRQCRTPGCSGRKKTVSCSPSAICRSSRKTLGRKATTSASCAASESAVGVSRPTDQKVSQAGGLAPTKEVAVSCYVQPTESAGLKQTAESHHKNSLKHATTSYRENSLKYRAKSQQDNRDKHAAKSHLENNLKRTTNSNHENNLKHTTKSHNENSLTHTGKSHLENSAKHTGKSHLENGAKHTGKSQREKSLQSTFHSSTGTGEFEENYEEKPDVIMTSSCNLLLDAISVAVYEALGRGLAYDDAKTPVTELLSAAKRIVDDPKVMTSLLTLINEPRAS